MKELSQEHKDQVKSQLKNIKDILLACKTRSVMPPYGMVELAKQLASQFPGEDFKHLLGDIIEAEKQAVQAVTILTNHTPEIAREFEKLLATEPTAAAKLYFEQEKTKKIDDFIADLEKNVPTPKEKFDERLKILEEERETRERIAKALAFEKILRDRDGGATPAELAESRKFLSKIHDHMILGAAASVIDRNDPHRQAKLNEKNHEIKQVFREHIAPEHAHAVNEDVFRGFAVHQDVERFKQAVLHNKASLEANAEKSRTAQKQAITQASQTLSPEDQVKVDVKQVVKQEQSGGEVESLERPKDESTRRRRKADHKLREVLEVNAADSTYGNAPTAQRKQEQLVR